MGNSFDSSQLWSRFAAAMGEAIDLTAKCADFRPRYVRSSGGVSMLNGNGRVKRKKEVSKRLHDEVERILAAAIAPTLVTVNGELLATVLIPSGITIEKVMDNTANITSITRSSRDHSHVAKQEWEGSGFLLGIHCTVQPAIRLAIHAYHLFDTLCPPIRNWIYCGSQLALYETFCDFTTEDRGELREMNKAGEFGYNYTTMIEVAEGVSLQHIAVAHHDHVKVVRDVTVLQRERSSYCSISILEGDAAVRSETKILLQGKSSSSDVRALVLGASGLQSDLYVMHYHNANETKSNQEVLQIVGGKSQALFHGVVHIPQSVSETIAEQLCRNVTLSAAAKVSIKPELDIHNQDTKCKHGATVDAIDEEIIYYLKSRGIDNSSAKREVIRGQCFKVLHDCTDDDKEYLGNALAATFSYFKL